MTYAEAVRHAVQAIIAADLTPQEIRKAVTDLIPEEHLVTHHNHQR